MIFVTADKQPNWWRSVKLGNSERIVGPHFELIRDIKVASGNRFMMYNQEEFLSEAPKYLDVPEQSLVIEEVKQIRESVSREKDSEPTESSDLNTAKESRTPARWK